MFIEEPMVAASRVYGEFDVDDLMRVNIARMPRHIIFGAPLLHISF